jgi:hypothetical protein
VHQLDDNASDDLIFPKTKCIAIAVDVR